MLSTYLVARIFIPGVSWPLAWRLPALPNETLVRLDCDKYQYLRKLGCLVDQEQKPLYIPLDYHVLELTLE